MKINKIITISALMFIMISTVGCDEFLDKEPYTPSPSSFFNNAEQLDAYVLPNYALLPYSYSSSVHASADNGTDNQVTIYGSDRWVDGQMKVGDNGNWGWTSLYNINYFFDMVLPKHEAGLISGNKSVINHYIGEMYFFRAYDYFSKLKSIGDVPIILNVIPDQQDLLIEASVRQPRNKVARQIIADLDKAIELMQDEPNGGTNRLSKNVALLFKSRVALYEASWERNFAGTAFVPNGEGWPGKGTHPNYEYNVDTEVNFFLDEALKSAEVVADAITLTSNPADYDYTNISSGSNSNPYFEMFGTLGQGLKSVNEVLLFKTYDIALGQRHNILFYLDAGGAGYTNQYMKNFLMSNGLPIYATGSGYAGDREINDIKQGRDNRLQLFVQAPSEVLNDKVTDGKPTITDVVPDLLGEYAAHTGYIIKKRAIKDAAQWLDSQSGSTADIIFRGVEAHLNYIEAYYLKNKNVGGKADAYWRAIRHRANVNEDYMITVNATDMAEEAKVDLAAYTAGELITPLEYNIRRERRSEFIAEGFRMDDLNRYRAMDQLISERVFVPQGFNLWEFSFNNPSYFDGGTTILKPGDNISKNENIQTKHGELMDGKYLYPQRYRSDNNLYLDGYTFNAAHYLNPIGSEVFISATPNSEGGAGGTSVIYQNPGWGLTSGSIAQPVVGFQ